MRASIPLRNKEQIEKARIAGALAAEVLAMITPYVRPGITTEELDQLCYDYIVHKQKAIPANVGYHGYKKTICASVNHVVCHGIPDNYALQEGDIVNIDIAVIKDGWFGDTSRMYYVGQPSPEAKLLSETTHEAMWAGIKAVRPGASLGDIGYAIQTVAHREGFSVVREYCGHGIGTTYHDEPQVLHYGQAGTGTRLKPGMIRNNFV